MKILKIGKLLSLVLVCSLLATCIAFTASAADTKVTPSNEDYSVSFKDLKGGIYISNKTSIGTEVGTEYYMTYTVKSVEHNVTRRQHGVIGTNVPTVAFPYSTPEEGKGGLMYYSDRDLMLKEGTTYFLKFTITEDGYDYRVGWGKGEDSRYVEFHSKTGKVTSGLGYFGVWFEDVDFSAELIKVRCYDKDGNDLGVQVNRKEATVYVDQPMANDTEVEHSYDIKVENQYVMNISNKYVPTSDTVYMEYTVKSGELARFEQVGLVLTDAPYLGFPYGNGIMYYNQYSRTLENMTPGPLMEEGASYVIKFERKADQFAVRAEKTKDGKTTLVDFNVTYGEYIKEQHFFGIWLSGIGTYANNFELVNFKCYDSNKVNLGVFCNLPATITHYGGLEDYRGLEGIFYSEEKGIRLDLNADRTVAVTQNGTRKEGSYSISNDLVVTTNIDGVEETYDYFYTFITDKDGNRYERMGMFKVSFETAGGNEVPMQLVGAEQNFLATKPEAPTMEGAQFVGWFTSDGQEFDFNTVITKSITLYAKWDNINYVNAVTEETQNNSWLLLFIGGTAVLLAGTIVGIVVIKRAKKHENVN